MKYIIDISKLKQFDIILTRSKHLRSKAIRYFSEGDYSHALICVSDLSLIEATVKGRVFSENPQRLIFENIDDCKVLRYKGTLNQEDQSSIELFLRSQISTLYSIKEAVRTRKYETTDEEAQEAGQFCSRLVAQAFNQVNINLVTNPNYCSPENLNSSELLETVPDIIRIATKEEIAFSKTKSQIKENQIQNYLWLDNVVKLAKKENFIIVSQDDVGLFLIRYPQYDKQVCKFIKSTNYLTQYKQDEVVNPPRYKYFSRVPVDILTELKVNRSIIKRHLTSYARSCDNYYKTKLNYCFLLKNLYKNLLQQANTRLNILIRYINRDLLIGTGNKEELCEFVDEIKSLQDNIRKIFTQDGHKEYL
ncbi:hypothetical protein ABLT88_14120 [Acinetobacter radioresistens]|uniref:hypothetical protein n=1 Tax=Acinetobacter radioresistens TaxID=40216 RepID=UPI0032B42D6D